MMTILMGLGLIVASGAVTYPFVPAKGAVHTRSWSSQWGDIIVAISVGAFIAGLVTTVIGVASF
jgi:hypothetical protein